MGLDIYIYKFEGDAPTEEDDERVNDTPSAKHPGHYFKIGYMRSSYNDSGINSVLRKINLPTLYDIFGAQDNYHVCPDWAQALCEAKSCLAQLEAAIPTALLSITMYPHMRPGGFRDEPDHIEITKKALAQFGGDDVGAFSNKDGFFFSDPLPIYSVVWGCNTATVVYKPPAQYWEWYTQALEIVIENIEWVLAQPDPQKFYLHWSS